MSILYNWKKPPKILVLFLFLFAGNSFSFSLRLRVSVLKPDFCVWKLEGAAKAGELSKLGLFLLFQVCLSSYWSSNSISNLTIVTFSSPNIRLILKIVFLLSIYFIRNTSTIFSHSKIQSEHFLPFFPFSQGNGWLGHWAHTLHGEDFNDVVEKTDKEYNISAFNCNHIGGSKPNWPKYETIRWILNVLAMHLLGQLCGSCLGMMNHGMIWGGFVKHQNDSSFVLCIVLWYRMARF